MSHNQKKNVPAQSGDSFSNVPESEARRVVYDVICGFCSASSSQGLNASKYAPHNLDNTDKNQQENKATRPQRRSQPSKDTRNTRSSKPTMSRPSNTRGSKHDPANVDDTSAFLAAMNRNSSSATASTSEPKPTTAESKKSSPSITQEPTTGANDPEEMIDSFYVVPRQPTRVVQAVGVPMDRGMSWLYNQAVNGPESIKKVVDIFTPGGPRTVTFYFDSLGSAEACHNILKKDPVWHQCEISYVSE
ncbi:hypothetical protein FQN54_008512 [Arachnomyces sp. PD_36]|nr:hypothetical protein FQN54_008512 [Arachnomyces sp. PD_36]